MRVKGWKGGEHGGRQCRIHQCCTVGSRDPIEHCEHVLLGVKREVQWRMSEV